jgi:hypothetical protein
MSSLKRGSHLGSLILKELPLFYARMRRLGIGWLVKPTLIAWVGSRLKMVGLDALLTCRSVVPWFPGTVEDMGRYFQ